MSEMAPAPPQTPYRASGLIQRRPLKRAKSPSQEQSASPCSTARAATCASAINLGPPPRSPSSPASIADWPRCACTRASSPRKAPRAYRRSTGRPARSAPGRAVPTGDRWRRSGYGIHQDHDRLLPPLSSSSTSQMLSRFGRRQGPYRSLWFVQAVAQQTRRDVLMTGPAEETQSLAAGGVSTALCRTGQESAPFQNSNPRPAAAAARGASAVQNWVASMPPIAISPSIFTASPVSEYH